MAKSYYITSRHYWHGTDALSPLRAKIRQALEADIDFIQIREKDMSAASLLRLCSEAAGVADGRKTQLLVNSRADVAVAAGVSGLHLPADGLALAALRNRLPQLQFMGVSCHNEKEAKAAEAAGVDYLLLGPVFETPSKPGALPLGIEGLAGICGCVSIPVFALGGVKRANAADCVRAGAAGIAGIRLFQEEKNLPQLIAEIRRL